MRNALSIISTDIRLSIEKKDPQADVTEVLRCTNARMVGLTTFHLDNFADLANRAKRAFDSSQVSVAQLYVEDMVQAVEDLKSRAERHEYLD